VASLLAEDYGFRVELTAPNIYQGTRAMLVLPKNLLTTPAAGTPAAVPVPSASAAEPEPPATSAATTPSGLTVRRRPATSSAPRRAAEPAAEPGRPAVAAAWARGTRRGREDESAPASQTFTGHDAPHDEGH
jgi:hypothetical protein